MYQVPVLPFEYSRVLLRWTVEKVAAPLPKSECCIAHGKDSALLQARSRVAQDSLNSSTTSTGWLDA